jgi:hypothetical protein
VLYYNPPQFGLTPEQVADLRDHPAMRDQDSEEPDAGGRIIYLPELFWQVMQHGWVRGGLEGDYDRDDYNVLHPSGLYLEGKSLADLAKAARYVAAEVEPDPHDEWEDNDRWTIETLRLAVRTGPQRDAEQSYRLSDKQARFFIQRGRMPAQRSMPALGF